ncbi:cold-shock protein [Streptomyces sp. NPDC059639]|uniref:cold-shock protein n=1 Tax=Streptomyces sp. NPDC059639 TaxID=3346891 RepID=UPI0036C1C13A
MAIGIVKWFNCEKGYGFITQNGGTDVFAHCSAINTSGHRELDEGEEVTFDVMPGPHGPRAENITRS